MHGIEKKRKLQGGANGVESSPRSMRINRIVVRYQDDRTLYFEPEAGRAFFSEDGMLELAKVLHKPSSTVEWVEVGNGSSAGS